MKKKIYLFCLTVISAGLIQGCSNYNPEKGNHYKDMEDTIKKDSTQAPKQVNPEDTVRKN